MPAGRALPCLPEARRRGSRIVALLCVSDLVQQRSLGRSSVHFPLVRQDLPTVSLKSANNTN